MDFPLFPVDSSSVSVLADAWSRRVVALTAAESALCDLRGLTLSRLLANDLLRVPYMILFKNGRMLPTSEYTRERSVYGQQVQGYVDRRSAARAIESGATAVFSNVEHWIGELSGMVADIGAAWRSACTASIFCTPSHSTGLTWHRDAHHGLVLQIEGTKVWNVERTPPSGLWREQVLGADFEPEETSLLRLELHPGDALYLPPGAAHHPETQDSQSVHMTLGVKQVSVMDVAMTLLRTPNPGASTLTTLRHKPAAECADVVSVIRDALGSVVPDVTEDCVAQAESELMGRSWRV